MKLLLLARPLALALALAMSACATVPRGAAYVPLVDLEGVDQTQFSTDVVACQGYAKTRMDAAQGALLGGLLAGLLGAAIAPHGYRNNVAVYGAGMGAVVGAAQANEGQETIVRRCLTGRGYRVLA